MGLREKMLARRKTQVKASEIYDLNDPKNLASFIRPVFGGNLIKIMPVMTYPTAVVAAFDASGDSGEAITCVKKLVDKFKREFGLELEDGEKKVFPISGYDTSVSIACLVDDEATCCVNIEAVANVNHGTVSVSFMEL